MKSYKKYKQGIYRPIHKDKCKSSVCIYRSKLELDYMQWLDNNPNIIQWSSEKISIPYLKPTDGKVHRYYMDFSFVIRDKEGKLHKFAIEVKPARQCSPPTPHGNKKASTVLYERVMWGINQQKWKAAREWAEKNGYTFTIVTEKDINELPRH